MAMLRLTNSIHAFYPFSFLSPSKPMKGIQTQRTFLALRSSSLQPNLEKEEGKSNNKSFLFAKPIPTLPSELTLPRQEEERERVEKMTEKEEETEEEGKKKKRGHQQQPINGGDDSLLSKAPRQEEERERVEKITEKEKETEETEEEGRKRGHQQQPISGGDDSLLSKALLGATSLSPPEWALYFGVVGLSFLLAGSFLASLEAAPFIPEALQIIGVAYCTLVASRFTQGKGFILSPASPIKAIIEFLDNGKSKVSRTIPILPKGLDREVLGSIQNLIDERDAAINRMEGMKSVSGDYERVLAEKEALEFVSMQLAQERDDALSEVKSLKQSIETMVGRMSQTEDTLAQEVHQLKKNNLALENVALQLASERDSVLNELNYLKRDVDNWRQADQEKSTLQLVQERDIALSELYQLKQVVERLQGSNTRKPSLNIEQEAFMKAEANSVQPQFTDASKRYEEQVSAAMD